METVNVLTTNGATAEPGPDLSPVPPVTPEHPACALIRKVDAIVREIDAAKRVAGRGGRLPNLGDLGRELMAIHGGLSPRPDWIPDRRPDPLPGLRAALRWATEYLADAVRDVVAGGHSAERYIDSAAINAVRASNALASIYQRGDDR
jgi:hypothetical protein